MHKLVHDKRSTTLLALFVPEEKVYEKRLKRVSNYMFAVEICDGRCVSVLDGTNYRLAWPIHSSLKRFVRVSDQSLVAVPTCTLTSASAHRNTGTSTDNRRTYSTKQVYVDFLRKERQSEEVLPPSVMKLKMEASVFCSVQHVCKAKQFFFCTETKKTEKTRNIFSPLPSLFSCRKGKSIWT